MTRMAAARLLLLLVVEAVWLTPVGGPRLPFPGSGRGVLSQEALAAAFAAQEEISPELLAIPGVVGTAVGLGAGERPVVMVYLEYAAVAGASGQLRRLPAGAGGDRAHHRARRCAAAPGRGRRPGRSQGPVPAPGAHRRVDGGGRGSPRAPSGRATSRTDAGRTPSPTTTSSPTATTPTWATT